MLSNRKVVSQTPVISANAIYAAGDQLGGVNKLAGVLASTAGCAFLESLVVIDNIKQSIAMDILFFAALPVPTSVDNGAISMPIASAAFLLGSVHIAATDYVDVGIESVATLKLKDLGLILQGAIKSTDLYWMAVTRGTPTYTGVDNLTMKFGLALP